MSLKKLADLATGFRKREKAIYNVDFSTGVHFAALSAIVAELSTFIVCFKMLFTARSAKVVAGKNGHPAFRARLPKECCSFALYMSLGASACVPSSICKSPRADSSSKKAGGLHIDSLALLFSFLLSSYNLFHNMASYFVRISS